MAQAALNNGGVPRSAPPDSSFFVKAPVSRACAMSFVASYLMAEVLSLHDVLSLDLDRLLSDGEIWRLWTCQFAFSTMGELLFGLGILCPLMRRFEREMGSRKYATFLILSSVLSMVWELLLSQIFDSVTRYSGPYHLCGSLLFLHHAYTPRLHPRFFGILGFDFSEKSVTYALALQLLCSGGWSTLLPSSSGVVAAFLCSSPALPVRDWELPEFVYALGSRFGGAEGDRPAVQIRRRPRPPAGGASRQRLVPDARNRNDPARGEAPAPFRPLPVPPPPSEEAVSRLTSMGFPRDAVVRVLQQCDNNVEVAADRLLSSD